MDLDLEISNYTMEELLNLFDIPLKFNHYHIKNAKRVVANLHPDKNRTMPIQYYHFYRNAYNVLLKIYNFKRQQESNNQILHDKIDYIPDEIDEGMKQTLNQTYSQETNTERVFNNKKFNELFEKHNKKIHESESGHGEWLKNTSDNFFDDASIKPIRNISHINDYIQSKKNNIRDIVEYRGVQNLQLSLGGSSGANLDNTVSDNDSSIFSNLQYQDLRRAHTTNSIFSIDDRDPSFQSSYSRSLEGYKTNRTHQSDNITYRGHEYLEEMRRTEDDQSNRRAMRIIENDRKNEIKQKEILSEIFKLTEK